MSHHHIRLLGDHHLTHAHGTVLGVSDDHAHVASKPEHLIHHDHAVELVSKGHAEWVDAAASEGHPGGSAAGEHADMLLRHASEHREMLDRHAAEHKAALAAAASIVGGGI